MRCSRTGAGLGSGAAGSGRVSTATAADGAGSETGLGETGLGESGAGATGVGLDGSETGSTGWSSDSTIYFAFPICRPIWPTTFESPPQVGGVTRNLLLIDCCLSLSRS